MTSTTDTAQHPDVAEISDFGEGVLPVARATEVRRHLFTCALCEDMRSSLEEIRSLLGSLPEPSPMPADVTARIGAALAGEALLHTRTPAVAPAERVDVSRETTTGDTATGESAGSGTAADEKAAGGTASRTAEQPTGHIAESTPSQLAGSAAGKPPKRRAPTPRSATSQSGASTGPGRRRSTRRRRIVLGTVFGAAILGMGTLVFQTAGMTAGTSSDDKAGSGAVAASTPSEDDAGAATSSAVEFTAAMLPEQVRGLLDSAHGLRRTEGSDSTPQGAGPSGAPTVDRPLRAPSVPACVQRALGRTASALAVETGVYRGADTYLVVLPHPTDGSLVTAYLVDAGCTASDSSDTGSLLFTHAYPRA
ncbi:anti-sigma factor family protein [Streptomyces sp. NPDC008125]|uniref:anti-sigma factor family protein n=1 Tax=Streptomyces sp. NPDC008125 TaxID=3364811 RepID=UPI0036E6C480